MARELEPTSDKRILRVKGFEVDSIRECRVFPSTRTGVFEVLPKCWALAELTRSSNCGGYVNGDTLGLAFTRTIMIGRGFISSRSGSHDADFIAHASGYWRRAWLRDLLHEHQGIQESMQHSLETIPMFDTTIHHACNSRTFFLTEGGCIGIGPHWLRPNDKVVILYGGKTPYILRHEIDPELDQILAAQDLDGRLCRFVGNATCTG
jgi:hypothetical protein